MVEFCDLVDEAGARLGRTVPRGTTPDPGEFFPVVHLWIMDENGEFLVQRRAEHLVSAPGLWATTAGYVQSGESGREAVIREAREEMGLEIDPARIQLIGHHITEHRRQEVWLLRVRRVELGPVSIGNEVSDASWESADTIAAMIEKRTFFAYRYYDRLIRGLHVASNPSEYRRP
jgi:8-oxo-dGTP pyrophosphatase MutT (NUDIX family)